MRIQVTMHSKTNEVFKLEMYPETQEDRDLLQQMAKAAADTGTSQRVVAKAYNQASPGTN